MKTIETISNAPFRHLISTIGELPTSFTESMSYYEMLAWLCDFIEKKVVPVVDANAEALIELQEYVVHYFDNLDVQAEIDHKLDEMAESGELAEIIAAYLEIHSILAYDNVAAMKLGDNLIEGSFAETYGFYVKGDGGGAKYKVRKITNADTVDNIHLFALRDDTLVAELMEGEKINVLQLGANGDGETDSSDQIDYALSNFKNVEFPAGTFIYNSDVVTTTCTMVKGNGTEIKATESYAEAYSWTFVGDTFKMDNMHFNSNNVRRGCVKATEQTMVEVTNCEFEGYSLDNGHYGTDGCLLIDSVQEVVVRDCYFHDSGYELTNIVEHLNRGITAQQCERVEITGCRFLRLMQAIVLQNQSNIVSNCWFDYIKDNNIYNLKDDENEKAGDLIASLNYISNRHDEGIVTRGNDNIITGNIFENIPNKAIAIADNLLSLIITGNTFRKLENSVSSITGEVVEARDTYTTRKLVFSHNNVALDLPTNSNNGEWCNFSSVNEGIIDGNIVTYTGTASGKGILIQPNHSLHFTNNILIDDTNSSSAFAIYFTTPPSTTYVNENNSVGALRSGWVYDNLHNTEYVQGNIGPYLKQGTYGGRIFYGAGIPSVGTWKQGDILFNNAPTAGGTLGWVCVTAGDPGTWKAITGISA